MSCFIFALPKFFQENLSVLFFASAAQRFALPALGRDVDSAWEQKNLEAAFREMLAARHAIWRPDPYQNWTRFATSEQTTPVPHHKCGVIYQDTHALLGCSE
jgi:hypothetical protein